MSHSPSRRAVDKFEAEQARQRSAERAAADAKASARATRIIDAWNTRVAAGEVAEFFPTIKTAILSGRPRLNYYCRACRQVGEIDLRTVTDAHHPRAPISVLIPALSCKNCCPNPPMATLLDLRWPYDTPTLAHLPFDLVRLACRHCDRQGRYRKGTLLEKYGDLVTMPDLLRKIAKCPRSTSMSAPCGVYYVDLATGGKR